MIKWALVCFAWVSIELSATTVKIGNGDDGRDLEGATRITEGVLSETQTEAAGRIRALSPEAIAGLGSLVPELEKAKLYLAEKDAHSNGAKEEGRYHANLDGLVFARTFAEPHAPVRFFPEALKLSKDALVALHVHEALHRALPPSVRENEEIVTALTLALTSPEATQDRVRVVANEYHLEREVSKSNDEVDHFAEPSNVGYSLREFSQNGATSYFPIRRMHLITSELYPFGGKNFPLGLGIEASLVQGPRGATQSGPLGLSAKAKVWSIRDFAISLWVQASLNVLSAEELKNSPFGRDVVTLGISMRKDLARFYIENSVSYSFRGESKQQIGNVNYLYDYGAIYDVKMRGGARVWKFDAGLYAELNLADGFVVNGGAFNEDFGRYRILSGGPELVFITNAYSVSLFGKFLLDSSKGASFDYLGYLLGHGVSQGHVGVSAKMFF